DHGLLHQQCRLPACLRCGGFRRLERVAFFRLHPALSLSVFACRSKPVPTCERYALVPRGHPSCQLDLYEMKLVWERIGIVMLFFRGRPSFPVEVTTTPPMVAAHRLFSSKNSADNWPLQVM